MAAFAPSEILLLTICAFLNRVNVVITDEMCELAIIRPIE